MTFRGLLNHETVLKFQTPDNLISQKAVDTFAVLIGSAHVSDFNEFV